MTSLTQLQRNLVALAAALVVGGGLIAVAYFGVHRRALDRDEAERRANRLLELDGSSDITAIRIAPAAGVAITAERASAKDRWRLSEPVRLGADQEAWQRLADLMATLRYERQLDGATDLAQFGLAPAAHTITVSLGQARHRVAVGGQSSFNRRVYVRRDDDPAVYVVDAEIQERASRDLFALRQKTLMTLDASEVQSIEVVQRGKTAFKADRSSGGWRLVSPRPAEADANLVNQAVGALTSARAERFAVDQPEAGDYGRFGLAPETLRVRVSRADGSLTVVLVGERAGTAYAALDAGGPIMAVSRALLEQLSKGFDELRDMRLLPAEREAVTSIELIEGSSLAMRLERRDGPDGLKRWVFGPTGAEASQGRAASLLYRLTTLRASRFTIEQTPSNEQLKATGLSPPHRRVVLFRADRTIIGTLAFGPPAPAGVGVPVWREGGALVGEVERTEYERLHLDPAYYQPENENEEAFPDEG